VTEHSPQKPAHHISRRLQRHREERAILEAPNEAHNQEIDNARPECQAVQVGRWQWAVSGGQIERVKPLVVSLSLRWQGKTLISLRQHRSQRQRHVTYIAACMRIQFWRGTRAKSASPSSGNATIPVPPPAAPTGRARLPDPIRPPGNHASQLRCGASCPGRVRLPGNGARSCRQQSDILVRANQDHGGMNHHSLRESCISRCPQ